MESFAKFLIVGKSSNATSQIAIFLPRDEQRIHVVVKFGGIFEHLAIFEEVMQIGKTILGYFVFHGLSKLLVFCAIFRLIYHKCKCWLSFIKDGDLLLF